MPRSAWAPSGISGAPVSAAKAPETSTALPSGRQRPFEAADQIDGGADRGEVEPVGRADIAPQDLAEMQRDAEGQGRLALPPPRLVEMRHSGPRGGDRAAARRRRRRAATLRRPERSRARRRR